MMGLLAVKKSGDKFSGLDAIHQCDRQLDRQADGRSERPWHTSRMHASRVENVASLAHSGQRPSDDGYVVCHKQGATGEAPASREAGEGRRDHYR